MTAPDFPAQPGTYILWLALAQTQRLQIGQLGYFEFPAGLYTYAGSAQGPGGLRARVGRHLSPFKTRHWHIDTLTAAAPVGPVWFSTGTERLECSWATRLIALPGVIIPVHRFGASDCRCPAHLLIIPPELIDQARESLRPEVTWVSGPDFAALA